MPVKPRPTIPEDTCPYIDMVQDLIEKMLTQSDLEWRKQQAETANALLEHIRASNFTLRQSSKYWYDRRKIR